MSSMTSMDGRARAWVLITSSCFAGCETGDAGHSMATTTGISNEVTSSDCAGGAWSGSGSTGDGDGSDATVTSGGSGGLDDSTSSGTGDGSTNTGEPAACGDPAAGTALEREAIVAIDCGYADCIADEADDAAARLPGPFTVVAELSFDERPDTRGIVVSRWGGGGQRSFELGIDDAQLPYVALSSDGEWESSLLTYPRAYQQLRVGEPYELAAVVVPGEHVAIYVDGILVADQTEVVPSLFVGDATLGLGRRPGDGSGAFAEAIGRVRMFDRALGGDEIADLATAHAHCASLPELPTITALTTGPDFHWFGYYDKHEFSSDDRWVLGMAVDFEDRTVTADDVAEIGMVDLENDNEWVPLGSTRAFNWQQGSMLQWLPGSTTEVIWNDREGEGVDAHFVARIVDVVTAEERQVPHPVYTIAPDGESALRIDFERLDDTRSGYGYKGIADPYADDNAPESTGLYTIDLETGDEELLFSIAEIAAIPDPEGPVDEAFHYFEMLVFNPSGTRFLFMDRFDAGGSNWTTRVFTADMNGDNLFMLTDQGRFSHITWMDDTNIVVYAPRHDGYAIYADQVGFVDVLLFSPRDGHETFLPGNEWLLSDTYPDVADYQHPFLYHLASNEVFSLAHLHQPSIYSGSDRCDNHPRQSRDGRRVVVDSAHDGGRQLYMIDIGDILDAVP